MISHAQAKRQGKMAWGVFEEHGDVSQILGQCLFIYLFLKSNIQTPVIEGRGFFFGDLDLEKHYVKLGFQVICVSTSSNRFKNLHKFHGSIRYKWQSSRKILNILKFFPSSKLKQQHVKTFYYSQSPLGTTSIDFSLTSTN